LELGLGCFEALGVLGTALGLGRDALLCVGELPLQLGELAAHRGNALRLRRRQSLHDAVLGALGDLRGHRLNFAGETWSASAALRRLSRRFGLVHTSMVLEFELSWPISATVEVGAGPMAATLATCTVRFSRPS